MNLVASCFRRRASGRPAPAVFAFALALSAPWINSARAADEAAPPPAPVAVVEEEEEFDEYARPPVSDPFERVNRTVFRFNDTVYRRVLRPVSRGYETVVPRLARRGLGSFFDNLRFPVRFVGSAMQGKLDRSAAETGKFLINSTVGLGGFIKVSDRIPELQVPEEDIGQGLGKWGIPPGPFLVLPVLGPSSTRDLFGRVGDSALTPTNWRFLDHYEWELRAGVQTLDVANGLPELLDSYDSFRRAAIDPYIAFRDGYLQYREAAVMR